MPGSRRVSNDQPPHMREFHAVNRGSGMARGALSCPCEMTQEMEGVSARPFQFFFLFRRRGCRTTSIVRKKRLSGRQCVCGVFGVAW